jgi:hypothetical protein
MSLAGDLANKGRIAGAKSALVFVLLLLTACAGVGPAVAPNLTAAEKMMWSTYALATPKGMASCVIVNRRDAEAPNGIVPVIVTSAHVLSVAPHGPFYLVIRERHAGRNPTIGILQFQAPDPADRPFFQHPRLDVAALELRIPPKFSSEVSLPSYIDEKDIAPAADVPHAGDEVAILGFPRVFPGTEGAFPILRDGKIASYSPGSASDREKFLVNTNVYGGDSGGPVFSGRRGGKPRLVGLVTERIGKKGENTPLAVAVNASAIRETLQLQAKQEPWYLGENPPNALPGKPGKSGGVQLVGPPLRANGALKGEKQLRFSLSHHHPGR